MSLRLMEMRHVLKETGSIYLHCDPTASHYLKLVMDAVFGKKNLRNEIVWAYTGPGSPKIRQFNRKHDIIFWYSKGKVWTFNRDKARVPYKDPNQRPRRAFDTGDAFTPEYIDAMRKRGKVLEDWWVDIAVAVRSPIERLGYPTQKPLKLLERIIKASSNEGDVVLDPFCGCGTTVHAAENLNRQWVGIDISRFSIDLMKERITENFRALPDGAIRVVGMLETLNDARRLAEEDRFEFEKWVCGRIGVQSMGRRKRPIGSKGPDGGVDGELQMIVVRDGKASEEYAVVQIKSGKVTPDAVKALSQTVEDFGASAGVMVCFEDQMGTVNNQRSEKMWSDQLGTYPYIQGLSIEALLRDEKPNLPSRLGRTRGRSDTAHVP